MEWLNTFLPKLRCPVTGQALHLATEAERQQHQLTTVQQALVTEDGSRIYPIVDGIPHLLPA